VGNDRLNLTPLTIGTGSGRRSEEFSPRFLRSLCGLLFFPFTK